MKSPAILAFFLVTVSSLFGDDNPRPDLFFYLADDQNYWDYGFAGNEKVTTPNVDSLAEQGTLFSRAYTSMAICSPSRSSLYTGLYPVRNGCYMNHIPVRSEIKSVTHHLKELGYKVVLAGKSHVKPNSVFDWSEYFGSVNAKGEIKDELPLDRIREFLEAEEGPVCIFFASDLPHAPYPKLPPIELDASDFKPHQGKGQYARRQRAGYYENIRKDDEQLGRLIEMLKETGRWDDSVFFYAPDHGIDGKYSTYDRGLRVPLIMRWMGHAEEGKSMSSLVHFIDIVPTMVEIAGGEAPSTLDGKSILPLIEGEAEAIHNAVYGLQTYQNIQKTRVFPGRCMTTSKYKLIINFNAVEALEKNMGDNPVVNEFLKMGASMEKDRRFIELYDLSVDPFELENLAKEPEMKEIRDTMLAYLMQWMREQGDFIELGKRFPLLKPTLHPLDETSRFKKVPDHLEGKLKKKDYMPAHY